MAGGRYLSNSTSNEALTDLGGPADFVKEPVTANACCGLEVALHDTPECGVALSSPSQLMLLR